MWSRRYASSSDIGNRCHTLRSHAWRGALSVDPICDRDAVFDGSDASRANEIKRMSTVNPAFRADLSRLLHQRRRRGAPMVQRASNTDNMDKTAPTTADIGR